MTVFRLKLNEQRKVKRQVKVAFTRCFSIKISLCACIWKLIPSIYLAAVRVLPALFVAFQPSRGHRPLLQNGMGLPVSLRST